MTRSNGNHTPLPWEVCNGIDIYPVGDVEARNYIADCDPDGACLGEMSLGKGEHPRTDSTFETKRADAAFIVRACNSHYDLLETLSWVRKNYAGGSTSEINARIDAAIRKAEGRT